jgi:hypothetical protein
MDVPADLASIMSAAPPRSVRHSIACAVAAGAVFETSAHSTALEPARG